MPQMTISQVRGNAHPLLTQVMHDFAIPEFVGNLAFPPVSVGTRIGKIIRFDTKSLAKGTVRRAPGANIATRQLNYGNDNYELYQDAVAIPLPMEHMQESRSEIPFNLQEEATYQAAMDIAEALENDQLTMLGDAANYPTANKVTLASPNRWSDANVNLRKQIMEAKTVVLLSCGREANTMILSTQAHNCLMEYLGAAHLIVNGQPNMITMSLILSTFGFTRGGIAAYGPRTEAATITPIFNNKAWIGHVPMVATEGQIGFMPKPNATRRMPSFGYTYTLENYPMVMEAEMVRYPTYSWVIPAFAERLPVLTNMGAGYLWSNVSA